jgi:hypothetical protein
MKSTICFHCKQKGHKMLDSVAKFNCPVLIQETHDVHQQRLRKTMQQPHPFYPPNMCPPPNMYAPNMCPPGMYPTAFSTPSLYPTMPTSYVPTSYVPTSYVPTTYVPTTYVPTSYVPTSFAPTSYVPAPNSYAPNSYAPNSYVPNSYAPNSYAPTTLYPPIPASTASQNTLHHFRCCELCLFGVNHKRTNVIPTEMIGQHSCYCCMCVRIYIDQLQCLAFLKISPKKSVPKKKTSVPKLETIIEVVEP